MTQANSVISINARQLIVQAVSLGNPSRQETSPRDRTRGRRRVEIRQERTFAGQPIEVWSDDLRIRIITGQIAIAEIVCGDDQDIGRIPSHQMSRKKTKIRQDDSGDSKAHSTCFSDRTEANPQDYSRETYSGGHSVGLIDLSSRIGLIENLRFV